jgi:hypothetical protein
MINARLNLTKDQVELKKRSHRVLGFWCFNAGLGFQKLKELCPKSIILTSGTMSPLDVFQHELMTPFKVRIQNTHVVKKEQTKVSVITHGIGGTELNFSHKNRESLDILTDLGNTIL